MPKNPAAAASSDPVDVPLSRALSAEKYDAVGEAISAAYDLESTCELLGPTVMLNEMWRTNSSAGDGKYTFNELCRKAEDDPIVKATEQLPDVVRKLTSALKRLGY